jgi:hypothetical protein
MFKCFCRFVTKLVHNLQFRKSHEQFVCIDQECSRAFHPDITEADIRLLPNPKYSILKYSEKYCALKKLKLKILITIQIYKLVPIFQLILISQNKQLSCIHFPI